MNERKDAAECRLELSPEEMRRLGYLVVDHLVEHLATLREQPAGRRASPRELEAALAEPLPEEGTDFDSVLTTLEHTVFANTLHLQHPRFFAFVPSPSNFVGVLADFLAAGYNLFVGTWFGGSGPAQLELVTLDWLCRICRLPEAASGLFVSGGSAANLTALATARRRLLGEEQATASVYFSDQTHYSVARALRVLGLPEAGHRRLRADADGRLLPEAVARALARDRRAGRRPFCVVANAGTTGTGAVDPLRELAALCRREGLWLHVDGAYGAAAMLSARGRRELAGLELADSVSLDPHKWLFQPFECGCVLLRDGALLEEAFRIRAEYMRDIDLAQGEVNFADRGVQLSRSFRALKLWMSFKVFGARAMAAAVDRGFELAEVAEGLLRRRPGWQVLTPARMGILTFRYAPPGMSAAEVEARNQGLVEKILADGEAVLTSTTLTAGTALRLCTINPRTTERDLKRTLDRLQELV